MRTVLFNLWPYVVRCVITLLVVAVGLVGGAWVCNSLGLSKVSSYLFGGGAVFFLSRPLFNASQTWRWLWRFARHAKTFETATGNKVTLRYSPRFSDKNQVIALLQQIETSIQELTERFGYSIGKHRFLTPYTIFASRRRRLTAYLVHDREEAAMLIGYWAGGYSLPPANAIVVVQQNSNPVFVARHEMVHLFAHYWNPAAPPLLAEGLATFLALGGENIVPTSPNGSIGIAASLTDLLRDFFNMTRVYQNYFLAYVFVASLIHHFGWEKFQRFYGKATPTNFAKLFRKIYSAVLRDDLDFGKPRVGSLREYARVGSQEGWPVEPAGIAVGSETLVPGTPVLASRHGSWWRAHVIEGEQDHGVRVRFVGWDESWDQCLPRDALQLDPGPMAGIDQDNRAHQEIPLSSGGNRTRSEG